MSVTLEIVKTLPEGDISPHIYQLQYETISGSHAYGVAVEGSDKDVLGFCIPPKEVLFPHLAGDIPGFGLQKNGFNQWIAHSDEVDLTIYNIVKFFRLAMDNNPNMIETLFTSDDLVTHSTEISEYIRDNRGVFLHKGSYHRFRGFAFSQLKKLKQKDKNWPRLCKFAYHCVRLLLGAEQILQDGNLQLDKHSSLLLDVRNGEWSTQDVEDFFEKKRIELDELYETSNLQHQPDESVIKAILLDCLEMHYGDISDCVRR